MILGIGRGIITVVVAAEEKSRVLGIPSSPSLPTRVVVLVVEERRAQHGSSNPQTKAHGATVEGLVAREQPGVGLAGVLQPDRTGLAGQHHHSERQQRNHHLGLLVCLHQPPYFSQLEI